MRRVLMTGGLLLCAALIAGLYLPRLGQVALRSAFDQYRHCHRSIIDFAPSEWFTEHEFVVTAENQCFVTYMNRREEILWRYFFLQTLAKRLI